MRFCFPLCLLFLFLIGSNCPAWAQAPIGVFERLIHEPSGLAQREVTNILKDKFGFVWMGTTKGLLRYDGHEIKVYNENPTNPGSLGDNFIRTMKEDRMGNIWVGTGGKGLFLYDRFTDRFTPITEKSGKDFPLRIYQVFIDSRERIWLATEKGIHLVNPNHLWIEEVLDSTDSWNHTYIVSMAEDSRGRFWLGTSGRGLALWDPVRRSIQGVDSSFVLGANQVSSKITQILRTRTGHLLIADEMNQLFQLDTDSMRLKSLKYMTTESIHEFTIRSMIEDPKGDLWLGSHTNGLIHFSKDTYSSTHYFPNTKESGSISSNSINALFSDDSGILWIGHGGSGVDQLRIGNTGFGLLPIDTRDISVPDFRCAVEDQAGRIWVGTMGNGVFMYDPSSQYTRQIRFDPGSQPSFVHNMVWDMIEDDQGFIWVATHQGLHKLNPEDFSCQTYSNDSGLKPSPIRSVLQDHQGKIWIGFFGGLQTLDPLTNQFQDLTNLFESSSSINLSLHEDHDQQIWISVFGKGVYRLNPSTLEFQHFQKEKNSIHSLSSNIVLKITEDESHNLWFACQGGGLNLFVPDSNHFVHWRTYNSHIPDDDIFNITSTSSQELWLSTGVGLVKFSPESQEFQSYDLPGWWKGFAITTRNAHSEAVCVGASNLIYRFYPEEVVQNEEAPPVFITHLEINGEPIPIKDDGELEESTFSLDQSILFTPSLELAHWQNDLTFEFSALNYVQSDKNAYKFQLLGYDEDWIETDAWNRRIRYTNLSPGPYEFKVIASNNDGVWNEEGKTLSIQIAFPWWQTWWAYLLYAGLLFGIVRTIYKFQLNRRLALSEAQRLKELDQAKSRLYTNVTHEFRTPLTVVLGMADKIQEAPGEWLQEGIEAIRRNGQQLLHLINQMLELSRMDMGRIQVSPQQADIIPYISYLVQSFQSYAQSRSLEISLIKDLDSLLMDYVPEALSHILNNLITNAIKYTPEGGEIEIRVCQEGDRLQIWVRDDGIGIPKEHLPHIFDRFYQVDTSITRRHEGTGIGLALVKEWTEVIQGEIEVFSENEKGTTFLLTLSISNQAPFAQVPQPALSSLFPIETGNGVGVQEPVTTSEALPLALIVEDHEDVSAYIASCLSERYQLHLAANGKEGLLYAQSQIPDIIISDVMMPEMDGYELCKALKGDERTSHIPVVMLTARADRDSRLEGLRTGADAYLAKPFHPEELDLRLENLIQLQRNLQTHFEQFPQKVSQQNSFPQERAFLSRLKSYILSHLAEEGYGIEEVCLELGISRSQLHRKLKALTGKSASHIIRSIRLEKAKEMVEQTSLNISEIAYLVGFSNPSYFSSSFLGEFGVSPTQMREKGSQQQ